MNNRENSGVTQVFSLPQNLDYYRRIGRFERAYVAGCVLSVALAIAYFSVSKLLPTLMSAGPSSFEFLAVASFLGTVVGAILLGLYIAIGVLGPGPYEMRLDAKGVSFEFARRRQIFLRWRDARFHLTIRRVSRALEGTKQSAETQIGVRALFIPHVWLSEPALVALISRAREQGLRVRELSGVRRGNWSIDTIEVRHGFGVEVERVRWPPSPN